MVLNYKIGYIPFSYFGISVGGYPSRPQFIDRVKKKLSGWKTKNLSLHDHLILL